MGNNIKVLIINPLIPEYRYPIFQLLASKLDLTILHCGNEIKKPGINFKQIVLTLNKTGPFTHFKQNIHKICKKYDVIISDANIRHIDRNFLILNPFRKYKWISWGIGVSASYDKKFDQDSSLDFLRYFLLKRADANVFYSDYPIAKYLKAGFKSESLFIADNTTEVIYSEDNNFRKKKLLFVGTLYKQKRIYDLLESYLFASKKVESILPLFIIGNGDEFDSIKEWISENKLTEKVVLLGALFDQKLLEEHFRESYACISPGQAGLSVLTSMGYGTPFITRKDAITGGEIFNIKDGENGILYEQDIDLENIIVDICNNPSKFEQMGIEARKYYIENRRPDQMVKGFIDAIESVIKVNQN